MTLLDGIFSCCKSVGATQSFFKDRATLVKNLQQVFLRPIGGSLVGIRKIDEGYRTGQVKQITLTASKMG